MSLISNVRRLYHGQECQNPPFSSPRHILSILPMPPPIQATIHTDALRHNQARARRPAPDARLWAVVKADAYGPGIARVFEGMRGADGCALLDLHEAELVRSLGWRRPILLLEGVFEPRDLELCS